jgi:uncharacterized protein
LTEVDRRREDEWFRQNELELLDAARLARLKRQAERETAAKSEERERTKALHFMKCPKCGHDLQTEAFEAIQIDRCTFCEGIFLDAGEIEQLFLKHEAPAHRGFIRRLLGI